MTIDMHPPSSERCQIYGLGSVRCINKGTHWVRFGGAGCGCGGGVCQTDDCERDFYTWECDGAHRFGDAAALSQEKEAA